MGFGWMWWKRIGKSKRSKKKKVDKILIKRKIETENWNLCATLAHLTFSYVEHITFDVPGSDS